MLILPKEELVRQHEQAKQGLIDHFNHELERILNENSDKKEIYWILGKTKFLKDEHQGRVARVFLQASYNKPPLVKEAFLYEVDNTRGTKTLLWVMHPGDILRLPTMNKTVYVGNKKDKRAKQMLGAVANKVAAISGA